MQRGSRRGGEESGRFWWEVNKFSARTQETQENKGQKHNKGESWVTSKGRGVAGGKGRWCSTPKDAKKKPEGVRPTIPGWKKAVRCRKKKNVRLGAFKKKGKRHPGNKKCCISCSCVK